MRVNRPGLLEVYLPEGAGTYSMAGALEDAHGSRLREREEARQYLDRVASRLAGARRPLPD